MDFWYIGFEFIPSPEEFNGDLYMGTNYMMEMKPFKTYHELLQNPYALLENDMKKFPQFPSRALKIERTKRPDPPENFSLR